MTFDEPPELPPEPRGWRALLRVPLLPKLVVADILINILAFVVMQNARSQYVAEIMVAALVVTLVLNAGLVYWALLPLRALESTAWRVEHGDLRARVAQSWLADRNIVRIGNTFNRVLDHLLTDRARVRELATQVIRAGDEERAHIARELHDSTAQQLSALEMLVAVSVNEAEPGPLRDRLGVMRGIVADTLAEVRTLSHTVHPRVLDDLGLVAGLEALARRTREQSSVDAQVTSSIDVPVPIPVASVLYRVAQEAVRNAVRHARPGSVVMHVSSDARGATLDISDDGIGFDVAEAEQARRGLGLFVMRERVSLIDGALTIESALGRGTRVRATAPLPSMIPVAA